MFNLLGNNNLSEKLFPQTNIIEHITNILPIGLCLHTPQKKIIYENKYFKNLHLKTIPAATEEIQLSNKYYRIKELNFRSAKGENLILTTISETTAIKEAQHNQETFFAMIAHDLKSPIHSESQALKLLLGEKFGPLTQSQREIIELLYNTNLYSKLLINNILSAYKLNTQGIELNLTTFDICRTIKMCKEIYDISAIDKGITIETKIPKEYYIEADINEIQRVIMNLLGNAIKYSFENQPIQIELNCYEDEIYFHIDSCGGYIPQKILSKLFDKNFSLKINGSQTGTGLGLYLCKEIIKEHSGKIIAQSFPTGLNIFGFRINISQSGKTKQQQKLKPNCNNL